VFLSAVYFHVLQIECRVVLYLRDFKGVGAPDDVSLSRCHQTGRALRLSHGP
jgi:hypothetical protein